jgi:dTMP kinase
MIYHSGYFLALEGGEATGKSTQLKLLTQRLRDEGYIVTNTHEPGGTPLGTDLRRVFLQHQGQIHPIAEIAILLASKLELLERVIKPALDEGQIVISDRYTMSLMVYQGILKKQPLATINDMLTAMCSHLAPHRTVWLHCDPVLSSARLVQRQQAGVELNSLDTLEVAPLRRLHDAYAAVYRDMSAQTAERTRVTLLSSLATDEMDSTTTCELLYQLIQRDLQTRNVSHIIRRPSDQGHHRALA